MPDTGLRRGPSKMSRAQGNHQWMADGYYGFSAIVSFLKDEKDQEELIS